MIKSQNKLLFCHHCPLQLTTTLEKCTKELEEAQKELEGKSLAIQELSQQRKILENKVVRFELSRGLYHFLDEPFLYCRMIQL